MERVSEAAGVSLQYILQQRHRSELPTPPNTAEIPGLPQMYQLTPTGGQFLLYDSGIEDHRRILIFAYDQGFELLSNSEIGPAMEHSKNAKKSFTRHTQSTH